MKILQVNVVYNNGSTGKITHDIHKCLQNQNIDSVVCYGRGEKSNEKRVYKVSCELYSKINHLFANMTGVLYSGCFFSTNRLISIIKKENPDIVHLQCINGYFVNIYRLLNWLKKNNIKTVLTLHAEFMYTGGCGHSIDCNQWKTIEGCGHFEKCPHYKSEFHSFFDRTSVMWKRMNSAFDGFNNLMVTSVSPWLMERAKESPILASKKHCCILNGIDTNIFKYYDTLRLRTMHNCEDKKVVFHATAYFTSNPVHLKGGFYVLEIAKRVPDVLFLVAGDYSNNITLPKNVKLLGKITDQELLAQYYSMADVTLLTSKRETFSMICAESLCCGTPVVGFKAGAPEQISIPKYSDFFDSGDVEGIVHYIKNMCMKTNGNIISKDSIQIYSSKNMVKKYYSLYCGFVEGE